MTAREVLLEDFLTGVEITQNKLTVSIGVPPPRINEVVHGTQAMTADMAGEFFEAEPQFWLDLQSSDDLEVSEKTIVGDIEALEPLHVPWASGLWRYNRTFPTQRSSFDLFLTNSRICATPRGGQRSGSRCPVRPE